MESDYCKRKNTEEDEGSIFDIGDLLQPSWIRCPIPSGDDVDRIILAYGCDFLWRIGIFLWSLFFII